jgi:uncharacterized phage protein (TIGR01671 family)
MREYKFRAWDKDNKEMLYQGSNTTYNNSVMDCRIVLDELGFDVLVRPYGKDEYEYRNNCELMQYTGLKDKNGKEIYEGDIIFRPNEVGRIEFSEDGSFLIRFPHHLARLNATWEPIEVIGNIHDNPELLGGAG